MKRTLILGAGVMGSAFAYPLCDAGGRVDIVGTHLDRTEVDMLQATGQHPRLPAPVPPTVSAHHIEELPRLLAEGPDLLVIGVSSPGVRWAADQVAAALRAPGTGRRIPCPPIVMLTKGLDVSGPELRPFPHLVAELLEASGVAGPVVGAVGGPCIAGELAERRHSGVVLGGPDTAFLDRVAGLLRTPYYHVTTSTDLVGVEVAAALKNFYTIGISAAGSTNPSAALFAQAVTEMARVAEALGGDPATVYALPGVGDLYVTCQAGRNSRLGAHLGRGLRYSEARRKHMPEDTVEGADLALALGPLMRPEAEATEGVLRRLDLPLAAAIARAICDDEAFAVPWSGLDQPGVE
jgi:glycerol-3-phosphate dehydrogenase (NAD(P)+)